jgi:tetraacyldisaccharide 4'-kinase
MKIVRFITLPLIPLYALIVCIRNWLFDKKILKTEVVNARVISIGNLTVGGSGKTPATIYLTELLKADGFKVGVLSRGYGRKSKGYVLVSDGEKILATVDKTGDEIYHTVLDCRVPAAVCEERVKGAKKLIEDTGVNILVLDDAFQHRWIKRDLDIVVIDQRFLTEKSFFTHNLLPAGNMREGFSSLKRADAIIINRKFSDKKPLPVGETAHFKGKNIFTGFYEAISFFDLKKNIEYSLNEFEGQRSLVVSGIARPYSFLNILSKTNVDTTNKLVFRDHKTYKYKDVQLIRRKFYSTNSHSVVTTEKDAVKLMSFSRELDDIDIFYLKIKFRLDDEDSFKRFIFAN